MSNKPQNSPMFLLFLCLTNQNTSSASGDLSLSMTTPKKQKSEAETDKGSSEKSPDIEPPVLWPQGFPHHVLPGWHTRILFPAKPWVIPSFFMEIKRARAACSEIFGECWRTTGNRCCALLGRISTQHFLASFCAVCEDFDSVWVQN